MPERLSLFATSARGTEDLLADELKELGAAKVRQDRGGVRFFANLHEALHVSLWTRIAMRVLYPVSPELTARGGAEGLYEAASSVAWEEHLTSESTFAVDATLTESEHDHSGFVALKIKDAIVDRLRARTGKRPDVDPRRPAVKVVAHLAKDRLALSLDLCGEPLHRRGYRVMQTAAPLKETLAAAILRALKYTGDESLLDPMCGSGTLLIEGALIAGRRAPALHRSFGVERWPHLGAEASRILEDLRADARGKQRAPPFPILGMDRDPEAVEAADRNVAAVGLQDAILLDEGDATAPLPLPEGTPPGLLVSNPPYGDRLTAGGQKGMKTFYFKLGEAWRALPWRLGILVGNEAFESAFHRRPTFRKTMWNGPIECQLYGYPPAQERGPAP